MVVSINTNSSALVALQQLNSSNKELDKIQERISSGYKVLRAKDDSGAFSVAQKERADLDAYDAVGQSVQRGINILDISIEALKTISNLLIDMRAKSVEATNPTLQPAERLLIDTDYQQYVAQLTLIINSATYDGVNIINKNPVVPATDNINVLSEPTANPALSIVIPAINITAATTSLLGNIGSIAAAQNEMTVLDGISQSINAAMATVGGNLFRLEKHSDFVFKLQDALRVGIGSLVDADLTRDSALLKSVQVQQQLSTQALQIANSRPQQILALFQNN